MSQNVANSVLIQKPDYSTHNLTQETKTTTKVGQLTPVYFAEVVPGDTVDINAEFLTKFQPLATPCMQNMNAFVHYFYVPFRTLWKNWKFFIQQRPEPGYSVPPLHPLIDFADGDCNPGFLAPYFGLLNDQQTNISPFLFLAYQRIWNDYYRHNGISADQTEDFTPVDGVQVLDPIWNQIRFRTYKDDYFTAALPTPQAGPAAKANILDLEDLPVLRHDSPSPSVVEQWASTHVTGGAAGVTKATNEINTTIAPSDLPSYALWVATSSLNPTIQMNDLIELSRMQEFLVRNNLAGNRYNEFVMAHFGVRVPDLRLDRPDYITGVKAPIMISEVLNTGAAQGFQTGQGNGYSEGGTSNYHVQEHGIIMGIYSCIPTQSYIHAVQKLLYKKDAMDYYLPVFDQMGEQPIQNKEVNCFHLTQEGTFGYVPRYAEYRLPFNLVTGDFATTLKDWHLADEPSTTQGLSEAWFYIDNPNRIFTITDPDIDNIMVQVINRIYITRPMNKYSMPVIQNQYSNQIT